MTTTLTHITFDCADAARVAGFWSDVLALPVAEGASADFATLETSGATGPGWMFISVPEGKTAKNRVHVDLSTDGDLEEEVTRLLGLGATRVADLKEDGTRWTTLLDPEGNEFDLVAGGD